jgi:predicted ATP-binding protein involved in virulence
LHFKNKNMTDNEIILLHDRLYEYLKGQHQANPKFLFMPAYPDLIPYSFFKYGYWFYESNEALSIRLLERSHSLKFVYTYFTQQWDCFLEMNKNNLSDKLKRFLLELKFSTQESNSLWKKILIKKKDCLNTLDFFIKNEKEIIDDWFKHHGKGYKTIQENLVIRPYPKLIEKQKDLGYVKERYRLLYDNATPHLPFALSRIEIIDFQGIKHLIIQDIPLDTQWIFLTGENGFGKTSVLRAFAKGLVGDEDLVESLPPQSQIYINGYNWNQPFFYSARSKTLSNNNFQVAMYGASRFRYHDDADKSKQKTFFLFSDEGKLTNIERVLITAARTQEREVVQKKVSLFDKLKKIFLYIIPQLADIKVEYIENELLTDREQVFYYEKGTEGEIFEPIRLEALAAGYRGILTMIGDMLIRLSKDPNNSLDDLQGMVLIDEIDAHLHPKYQYDLPRLLSEIFPKIQFIATTHSPIPLLSVPQNKSVILTVERNLKYGITVNRKDEMIDIKSLNPNALLTSPIFGFHHLFAVDAEAEDIEPVDNYKEVETMNKIKARLKSLRQRGVI